MNHSSNLNTSLSSSKSKVTATLLCLFLGCFGVHRFYLGKTGSGIAQLLTMGGLGFWYFFDLIQLIRGKFTDVKGAFLTD